MILYWCRRPHAIAGRAARAQSYRAACEQQEARKSNGAIRLRSARHSPS